MSIVPTTPSETLLQAAEMLPTPTLIYDLDAIEATLGELRADLAVLGSPHLYFAVKANRCPALLRRLGELGLGGNVASLPEIEQAAAAGLHPLCLTTPFVDRPLMQRAAADGIDVDLDSPSQVEAWGADGGLARAIGLRLRVPLEASNRAADEAGGWSRFGVDATDRDLHAALRRHRLRVVRLHIHAGELRDATRARLMAEMLAAVLDLFPDTNCINLGGGLTYLYADRGEARAAWQAIAGALPPSGQRLRLMLEPGMLPTALAGYLLAGVVNVGEHPNGRRLAALDASAWNLAAWSVPRLAAALPRRLGPTRSHDLAGNTCYEQDYFIRDVAVPTLQVGDRVLLSGFGAYAASMARTSHGLPVPPEWIVRAGQLSPGTAG